MEEKRLNDDQVVSAEEVADIAENPEAEGFHQEDSQGNVFARSSGDFDTDDEASDATRDLSSHKVEADPEKVRYLQDEADANRLRRQEEPHKDESAAVPMQSPLQTAPERHTHSEYETDVQDVSADDADFDADDKEERKNDA